MSAPQLGKLRQTTLVQAACAELLDYISDHRIAPGNVLPSESKIAEQLGVSRTVVREALYYLQGQGIIRMVNGRGAEVRAVGPETLQVYFRHALHTLDRSNIGLMEVRRGIEAESARLCALRRSREDLDRLRAILEAMRAAGSDRDYARLDTDFHVAIAEASGNTVLTQIVLALRGGLLEASIAGLARRTDAGEMREVQARHEEIFDAIQRADSEAASRAMCRHTDEAVRYLSAQ